MAAKKKSKNFIAGAIKHPGALTKKAQAAHKTVAQFMMTPPKNASTQTKRQINFAKLLAGFHHKKKKGY